MARVAKDEPIEAIPSETEDSEVSLPGYHILSYPADFTLEVLVGKWGKGEIVIPPLQRLFLWSQIRASKLIESFLMGLPVPPVFFYLQRGTNKLLVVDGHQRLRSIVDFFSGKFGDEVPGKERPDFILTGLDDKSPYHEISYERLRQENESSFNMLNNSVLRSFVVQQIQPEDDTSIFQIFERLNTGGVVLQGQEIRNCIYDGTFNEVLCGHTNATRLNKDSNWRKIFGSPSEDKRQRDVELILRFFALHYSHKTYKKPMKDFLNKFMKTHRRDSPNELATFCKLFRDTAAAVIKILGEKPFHIHVGLNAAVYDSVFTAFADNLDKLSANYSTRRGRSELKVRYEKLLRNKKYISHVSSATTDQDVVSKRLRLAKRILFGSVSP